MIKKDEMDYNRDLDPVALVRVLSRLLKMYHYPISKSYPKKLLYALHELQPKLVSDDFSQQDAMEGLVLPIIGLVNDKGSRIHGQRNVYCSMDYNANIIRPVGAVESYAVLPLAIDDDNSDISTMLNNETLRTAMPDTYRPEPPLECDSLIFNQFELEFGSDYMVLQVQRTQYTDEGRIRVKNPINVDINLIIGGIIWDLSSFIEHVGTGNDGGHYISYVRRGIRTTKDCWYKCNDSSVKKNKPTLKNNTRVACVVYKRRRLSDRTINHPLKGFTNVGNTCWMNAGLQLLFSLPTVIMSLTLLLSNTLRSLTTDQLLQVSNEPLQDVLGLGERNPTIRLSRKGKLHVKRNPVSVIRFAKDTEKDIAKDREKDIAKNVKRKANDIAKDIAKDLKCKGKDIRHMNVIIISSDEDSNSSDSN